MTALPFTADWVELAHDCIKCVACSHASSRRRIGVAEVSAYVRASSTYYVCPAGMTLLKQHGCNFLSSHEQYMGFVSIMEVEFNQNTVCTAVDRLKEELHAPVSTA